MFCTVWEVGRNLICILFFPFILFFLPAFSLSLKTITALTAVAVLLPSIGGGDHLPPFALETRLLSASITKKRIRYHQNCAVVERCRRKNPSNRLLHFLFVWSLATVLLVVALMIEPAKYHILKECRREIAVLVTRLCFVRRVRGQTPYLFPYHVPSFCLVSFS